MDQETQHHSVHDDGHADENPEELRDLLREWTCGIECSVG
jgi:hypothetical protein